MKKGMFKLIITSSLVISSAVFLLNPYEADALFGGYGPFGGMILVSVPCDFGFLETLSLPTPGLYMYLPGVTTSFLWIPPIHPGQWVLGISGPPVVCIEGPVIIGAGWWMVFEGASF